MTGKLWPEGEQTADLHAHLSEVVFGLSMLYLKWKSKTFYKLVKPNQKSKLSFYTLYHSVSDSVIKRLQPLLSHNPFSNSNPLGFISLYFPLENRSLLPLETLSLTSISVLTDVKSSIPGQKSIVMNHGEFTGVAPSLGSEAGRTGGDAGAGGIRDRLPTLPRRAWWYWERGHDLHKEV